MKTLGRNKLSCNVGYYSVVDSHSHNTHKSLSGRQIWSSGTSHAAVIPTEAMTYSTSRDFAPRLNLVRTESHQGQHAHTPTRRDPLSAEKVKDVGLWVTLLSKALSVAGWKITNQLLQFHHLWSNPGATTALAASLQRVLHDGRSTDSVVTSRLKILLCHTK